MKIRGEKERQEATSTILHKDEYEANVSSLVSHSTKNLKINRIKKGNTNTNLIQ